MAASNVADNTYDGHGRRVKTTSANGTEYSFYDKAGRLVYREKADGQDIHYVFLNKLQVAKVKGATASKPAKQTALTTQQSLNTIYGTPTYIHTDLLGSPVVESSQSGTVNELSRMHYRPFGETKETPKDEVGYTGHKFDTDIGLVYAQQRYYDAEIGRFYSNDPVGYIAKNPVMSFNRYLYVNNNPYKYTDPSGKFLNFIAGAVGGALTDAAIQYVTTGEVNLGEVAVAAVAGAAGVGIVKNVGKLSNLLGKSNKMEILDGVHRAKAAQEAGKKTIKAEIEVSSKTVKTKDVKIDDLLSPKSEISTKGAGLSRMSNAIKNQAEGNVKPIRVTPGNKGTPIKDIEIN